MRKAYYLVILVLLMLAGCTAKAGEKGEAGEKEEIAEKGEYGERAMEPYPGVHMGGEHKEERGHEEMEHYPGISENWCPPGAYWEWHSLKSGESVKMVIDGVVEHEGKTACKATWTGTTREGQGRWEAYFDRYGKYVHILFYDTNGNLRVEEKVEENSFEWYEYDEQGNVINKFSSGQIMQGMPQMPMGMGQ